MNGDHEYRLNQHYRAERQRQAEQHQLAAQIGNAPRRPIRLSIAQVRRVRQGPRTAGLGAPVTARTL
jgi:hypothetical protein